MSLKSIAELEDMIRAGDFSGVARYLNDLNLRKIPRPDYAKMANIANRVDLGRWTLKLMNPLVQGHRAGDSLASDAEKLEYAEALRRMGAPGEAFRVLGEIDERATPIVSLRRAFCLISEWRYGEAISHLRAYIQATQPGEYSRAIAQVNLAAALSFENRNDEAEELLTELLVYTAGAGLTLLHGNCVELKAHVEINRGNWDKASALLQNEAGVHESSKNKFSSYARKWLAISRSLSAGRLDPDLPRIRKLAEASGNWETIRECDFYQALVTRETALLQKVYFGTPYASYRRKIMRLAGDRLPLPDFYVWANQADPGPVLDLLSAEVDGEGQAVPRGFLMHQLLLLLCRDFYRPIPVIGAFSALFPNEHPSSMGAPNRVHQIVKRLRSEFESRELPLQIEELNGSYRLKLTGDMGICVPREFPDLNSEAIEWTHLRTSVQSNILTKQDLISRAACSNSTAKRLLRWAVDTGKAKPVGSGHQRKYLLTG